MLQTARTTRGMVVAPHNLAAQAGLDVLREGGTAAEAIVAAAACIAVVYPHMNALGGDNFWLLSEPGRAPIAIDACGPSARLASRGFYAKHDAIPSRGPLAALTVAGAVAGWKLALEATAKWGGRLPIDRLFADAIHYARDGTPVPRTLAAHLTIKRGELDRVPGFNESFLPQGCVPEVGDRFRQPSLAATLEHLAEFGLDDFYRGELARLLARELEQAGSPLRLADFEAYRAIQVRPMSITLKGARVFNIPPPTQGLASLIILGLFERLGVTEADGFEFVHGLVEASKRAFIVRDTYITDPAYMRVEPETFLEQEALDECARDIAPERAMPWPHRINPGDTVWLGAIDGEGRAVSFIQSVYWEFGSGLVLPESGVLWQNRGTSFSLVEGAINELKPGRKPFHTIQPALAMFDDGRLMVYGTMGGEGQPQTQAAVFTRIAMFGQEPQQAVTAPRWLLGRTWGAETTNLRIEDRFPAHVLKRLRAAGHDLEIVGPFEEAMGHAGVLLRHGQSAKARIIEGAADPRSDGQAVGY
jgi:oxamate amidohydrolase